MRVQRLELTRQPAQSVVDDPPDRPQRMIRRHPGFQINIAEQTARLPILAPHPPCPISGWPASGNLPDHASTRDFLSTC
jgi:hypothetical protein